MLNYTEAKRQKENLETKYSEAGKRLKNLPGVGSGNMGLTPEHIRQSTEYKAAKRDWDNALIELRNFNSVFVKRFKKEIREERRLS